MLSAQVEITVDHRVGGFIMIENLIAFVILSVGLMAIVSLLTISKTSQHQAIQRSRAVMLADTIVERIRINPKAVTTYNIGTDSPVGDDPDSLEPSPDCRTAACDPNELAVHDLWAWEQALAGAIVTADGDNVAGLMEPRGCIVFTPAAPKVRTGLLNVMIQWRGRHESYDAVQGSETVCGSGAAGSDNFRRQVVVNTFVIDDEEL